MGFEVKPIGEDLDKHGAALVVGKFSQDGRLGSRIVCIDIPMRRVRPGGHAEDEIGMDVVSIEEQVLEIDVRCSEAAILAPDAHLSGICRLAGDDGDHVKGGGGDSGRRDLGAGGAWLQEKKELEGKAAQLASRCHGVTDFGKYRSGSLVGSGGLMWSMMTVIRGPLAGRTLRPSWSWRAKKMEGPVSSGLPLF